MLHGAETITPQIVLEYERSPDEYVWTEGLQWYNGYLYESTGSFSALLTEGGDAPPSRLQKLKLELEPGKKNGKVKVEEYYQLAKEYFGEGLARKGSSLYQLTLGSASVFAYKLDSLSKPTVLKNVTTNFSQRWGLCYDGKQFYMSNGSNTIWIYKKLQDITQEKTSGKIVVMLNGQEAANLNDLEFAGGYIYAAVRLGEGSNLIYKINPKTGNVEAMIDAANLRKRQKGPNAADLNGIAYYRTDPKDNQDVFLVTGKLWSKIFEVKFGSQKS